MLLLRGMCIELNNVGRYTQASGNQCNTNATRSQLSHHTSTTNTLPQQTASALNLYPCDPKSWNLEQGQPAICSTVSLYLFSTFRHINWGVTELTATERLRASAASLLATPRPFLYLAKWEELARPWWVLWMLSTTEDHWGPRGRRWGTITPLYTSPQLFIVFFIIIILFFTIFVF